MSKNHKEMNMLIHDSLRKNATSKLAITVAHDVWAEVNFLQDGELVMIGITAYNEDLFAFTGDEPISVNLRPEDGFSSGLEKLEEFCSSAIEVTTPLRWALLCSVCEVLMHLDAGYHGEGGQFYHFTFKYKGGVERQMVPLSSFF